MGAPATGTSARPSTRSVLEVLTKSRLLEVGRGLDVSLSVSSTKQAQIEALIASGMLSFSDTLGQMGRAELKAACRRHELDDAGRARRELAERLLGARDGQRFPTAELNQTRPTNGVPRPGDIVCVRQRQYLVEAVNADGDGETLVELICIEDDAQGRPLSVLWERELGAAVRAPHEEGLGEIASIDPPRAGSVSSIV